MGRAIVRDPQVFLFDEPLSNLDAKLRSQMRIELRKLHQRLATTSLYVTHDQVEAMTLANRIVVMNAGRAEQIGAPADVYARPASRFVASFIGSPAMNLLPGRIEAGALALAGGGRLRLDDAAARAFEGREVELGIRPEQLVPVDPAQAAMVVAVELVEVLGGDTIVHARLGEHAVTARLREGDPAWTDGTIGLSPLPGALHMFDPQTGRRID
jgi:sn-glycerol 3-phosphate transport system ATP-binding protein